MMFIDEPSLSYSLDFKEYEEDVKYKSIQKYKHKEVADPNETNDYIKQYIHSKSYCRSAKNDIEITKNNKTYIAKYLASNKYYNAKDHRRYQDMLPMEFGFVMVFITLVSSLFCLIPNLVGPILFTVANLVVFASVTICTDKYTSFTCGAIALTCFLIGVFVIHFALSYKVSGSIDYSHHVIEMYKAFHTIYPEYLFKFKF